MTLQNVGQIPGLLVKGGANLQGDANTTQFLPPANEVWGKVIFSQASVILPTMGLHGHSPVGMYAPRVCMPLGTHAPQGTHAHQAHMPPPRYVRSPRHTCTPGHAHPPLADT